MIFVSFKKMVIAFRSVRTNICRIHSLFLNCKSIYWSFSSAVNGRTSPVRKICQNCLFVFWCFSRFRINYYAFKLISVFHCKAVIASVFPSVEVWRKVFNISAVSYIRRFCTNFCEHIKVITTARFCSFNKPVIKIIVKLKTTQVFSSINTESIYTHFNIF